MGSQPAVTRCCRRAVCTPSGTSTLRTRTRMTTTMTSSLPSGHPSGRCRAAAARRRTAVTTGTAPCGHSDKEPAARQQRLRFATAVAARRPLPGLLAARTCEAAGVFQPRRVPPGATPCGRAGATVTRLPAVPAAVRSWRGLNSAWVCQLARVRNTCNSGPCSPRRPVCLSSKDTASRPAWPAQYGGWALLAGMMHCNEDATCPPAQPAQ